MKKFSNIFFVAAFVIGLSLLLYPTVSDYWNQLHASKAVATYAEEVANLDEDVYQEMLDAAYAYNEAISSRDVVFSPTDAELETYYDLLDIDGSGIMGYIEIPTIGVSLPIYHGTDEAVLQVAAGHLEWTSLPVGGEGCHAALSGHRGLPSAKLFTDLDDLAVGDLFMIRVLNELMTYEVDQILIVEPEDISGLMIEDGQDYCTLITCTPYGINTHRLLVRGHRVENVEISETVRVTADALQIEPIIVAPVVAIPLLLILLLWLSITDRRHKGE